LGHTHTPRDEGIPRVVFSDPEVAAVGLSPTAARSAGIATAEAEVALADAIARPWTYEKDPTGTLDVLVDQVAQFPTYTEAYVKAIESLER